MTGSGKFLSNFLLKCVLLQFASASLKKSTALSPFRNLASFLSDSNNDDSISSLTDHLKTLSKSQSALKNIDGTSYEFYQRSHNKDINEAITGRAERTAGRVGACADALFACELLDQAFEDDLNAYIEEKKVDSGIHRSVVLNATISDPIPMAIVVIYEESYDGGAGVEHGGINGLMLRTEYSKKPRGRLLIVLKDYAQDDLVHSLQMLDDTPTLFELSLGLVSGEIACVNSIMWKSAAKILHVLQLNNVMKVIEEKEQKVSNKTCVLNDEKGEMNNSVSNEKRNNELPAIHIVGRSISGGVAALAALMLDGTIPHPETQNKDKKRKHGKKKKISIKVDKHQILAQSTELRSNGKASLHGQGKLRTSCVALGAPPSISANIKALFITSIIHGDDIICRATKDSLDRLRQRVKRIEKGNVLTKQVGWMTDTLSLTVSSLKNHAHGSEGEEGKLSTPGKAYIIRPRRMKGGVSSINEIGSRGGREALRGALLWQLNDILLSRSMWKHHSLESYISGLNRVELRKFTDSDDEMN